MQPEPPCTTCTLHDFAGEQENLKVHIIIKQPQNTQDPLNTRLWETPQTWLADDQTSSTAQLSEIEAQPS